MITESFVNVYAGITHFSFLTMKGYMIIKNSKYATVPETRKINDFVIIMSCEKKESLIKKLVKARMKINEEAAKKK